MKKKFSAFADAPEKNSIVTLEVTDLNNLGYGVARCGNMVVFVDSAVTGETVEAKIIKITSSYAVARVEKTLSPSPVRTEPRCKSFTGGAYNSCGGCVYASVTYAHELELKRNYVAGAFIKAGMPDVLPSRILTTGAICGYRNKVVYPVSVDGRLGYYAAHSHRVTDTDKCVIQSPSFEALLNPIRKLAHETGGGNLKHVYLREGSGGIMSCAILAREDAGFNSRFAEASAEGGAVTALINYNPDEGNVILGDRCEVLYGDGFITDRLCGLEFRISPLSFYQINRSATELLYGQAIRMLSALSPSRLLDLYCGIGTIGITAASRLPGLSVTGVEVVPDAIENARFNAEHNKIENIDFILGDAADTDISGFDAIVVDPPRKGLDAALTDRLCSAGTDLIYISCNCETLARDAVKLTAGGYTMGEVICVDMFPGTGSVEVITTFTVKK